MINSFTWPMVRLVQRLCMVLTLFSCLYVIYFFISKSKEYALPETDMTADTKTITSAPSLPVFDLKPFNSYINVRSRDIFSMPSDNKAKVAENTPKGQLPDHLKIVGILVDYPSQIIIEDSLVKKTYFIDEGKPQAGISIVRVSKDRMIIQYKGQDIPVPITKN